MSEQELYFTIAGFVVAGVFVKLFILKPSTSIMITDEDDEDEEYYNDSEVSDASLDELLEEIDQRGYNIALTNKIDEKTL